MLCGLEKLILVRLTQVVSGEERAACGWGPTVQPYAADVTVDLGVFTLKSIHLQSVK